MHPQSKGDRLDTSRLGSKSETDWMEFAFVPPHLLENGRNGRPLYEFFLGGRNRQQRRLSSHFFKPVGNKKGGDDATAGPDFFAPANVGRIPYFWQDLKGESKSNFLMNLLRTYEPQLTTLPMADPEVLRRLVPVYDQILERFDCCAPRPVVESVVGRLFAWKLWERVLEDMKYWDDLTEEQQLKVVNVVYAVGSIFVEEWFFHEAARLVPEMEGLLLNAYLERKQAVLIAPKETTRKPSVKASQKNTEAVAGPEDSWQQLGETLAELSGRFSAAGKPSQPLVDELKGLVSQYDALMEKTGSLDSLVVQLAEQIRELLLLVRESAGPNAAEWLDFDELEDRWTIGFLAAADKVEAAERMSSAADHLLDTSPKWFADCRRKEEGVSSLILEVDGFHRAILNPTADRKHLRKELRQKEDMLDDILEERDVKRQSILSSLMITNEIAKNDLANEITRLFEAKETLSLKDAVARFRTRGIAVSIAPVGPPVASEEKSPVLEAPVVPEETSGTEILEQEASAPVIDEVLEQEIPVESPELPDPVLPEEVPPVVVVEKKQREPKVRVETKSALPQDEPAQNTVSQAPSAADQQERGRVRLWYFAGESEPAIAARLAKLLENDSLLPDLFELAALAKEIQLPNGALAHEISSRLASGSVAENIEKLSGNDRLVANLIAMAAIFRPSLLLPDPRVAELTSTIKVSGKLPETAKVIDALLSVSVTLQSYPMTADVLRQVISVKSREAGLDECREKARVWLDTVDERSRSRYRAAMKTFRVMAASGEDGWFHTLLTPIANNDRKQIGVVKDMIRHLDDKSRYERKINEIDLRENLRRSEKISYNALDWLNEERTSALSIAQNWVSLHSLDQDQGYIQETVLNAIRAVQGHRTKVEEELKKLADTGADDVSGAAKAALCGFQALVEICGEGIPLPPNEPSASTVLAEPLLRLNGYHVLERGGLDPDVDEKETLLSESPVEDWETVWQQKGAEGDFLAAAIAVSNLPGHLQQEITDTLASQERQLRARLLHEARQTEVGINTLERLRGIPEADAKSLLLEVNNEINALGQDAQPERRMDRTRKVLDRARNEIAAAEARVAQALRERVEILEKEGRAPRILSMVRQNIDDQNFVVAEEYLDMASREGDDALDYILYEQDDVFERFYRAGASGLGKSIGDMDTDTIATAIQNGESLGGISFLISPQPQPV